jgi:hypothetical protein
MQSMRTTIERLPDRSNYVAILHGPLVLAARWSERAQTWQASWQEFRTKGTIFAIVYRRLVPRLGHAQAIDAIAHRLCRLI